VQRGEHRELYTAWMKKMFFVYLLMFDKNGSFYIGFTEDPGNRLRVHNAGGNLSTKSGRPWKLIYFEAYTDKRDALGREKFLKSGSGYQYLKKQLRFYLGEVELEKTV
jgi:putative endonuclease